MKQIFLINGQAQHGKDSTANILKEYFNNSLILHFADYLKFIAKDYLCWNGKKDEEGRTLLQWLGTDRVRIGLNKPMFWAERVCEVIEILDNKFDYFFIPDCRFPNELFYTKSKFPNLVSTIHVERLNFDNGLSMEQKNHPSETAFDNFKEGFDYYISSESGLDALEVQIVKFIVNYRKEQKFE